MAKQIVVLASQDLPQGWELRYWVRRMKREAGQRASHYSQPVPGRLKEFEGVVQWQHCKICTKQLLQRAVQDVHHRHLKRHEGTGVDMVQAW